MPPLAALMRGTTVQLAPFQCIVSGSLAALTPGLTFPTAQISVMLSTVTPRNVFALAPLFALGTKCQVPSAVQPGSGVGLGEGVELGEGVTVRVGIAVAGEPG